MIFDRQFSTLNPRSRAGGPRYVRKEFLLTDGGFDNGQDTGGSGGDSLVDFNPISTLPKVMTPTEIAESLGGGLTLAQLDRAALFEVDEGAPIGIFYGRVLFALKLVSHLYEPGPGVGLPRNNFTGILGEGWGGLGRHGEFNRIVKAWQFGEELTSGFNYQIYVDDALPAGAVAIPGADGWNWITRSPTPYSRKFAHQAPNIAGTHFHQFSNATQTMPIVAGDQLFCFVWLDPTNPPTEVMLQWQVGGDAEHRAYWGANSVAFGVNGTNSQRQVSASVPTPGQWVLLQVPATDVGLVGLTVNGMAFICFGGSATWDQAGKYNSAIIGGTYLFRPGVIPTDAQTIEHAFLGIPTGQTYSGSANVFVRLNTAQSAQDRPDGFKCIAECRKTYNYDATGAEIGNDYSANPARAAADRGLFFFQRRYRDRLDIAQEKFRRRFNWPSWVDFRENSAKQIPWDRAGDGVTVYVPRFEFNSGFTEKTTLAQALDEICGQSATGWQDDGEQITFLPPSWPPAISHHFHPGNIVRAPQRSTAQNLGSRPNRFIGHYRDSESEFLEPAVVEPPDDTPGALLREDSIDRVGEIRSEHAMGGMSASQAGRLIEYVARLTHDNPVRVNLVGNATAIHLLKWDFVTVSHPELGWDYQLCLVLSVRVRSREQAADEVEVILQRIDGELYSDTAHRPRQEPLTL
jgi:hypothetical protein